jgi:hypothetical protein
MSTETVQVNVRFHGNCCVTLRFRREVYERLRAAAWSQGLDLEEYLAQKVIASGLIDGQVKEENVTYARTMVV